LGNSSAAERLSASQGMGSMELVKSEPFTQKRELRQLRKHSLIKHAHTSDIGQWTMDNAVMALRIGHCQEASTNQYVQAISKAWRKCGTHCSADVILTGSEPLQDE
jgi:hypothetical protein